MNKVIEYETIVKVMQEMELGHTITLVTPSRVRTFTLTDVKAFDVPKEEYSGGFVAFDELIEVGK
jgi:hypothetical protein